MFQVASIDGFKGLKYIGNTLPSNTFVYKLKGKIVNKPTRTSIKIGINKHIEDVWGQYINHSCNPSVIVKNDTLISVKEIRNGDFITFDYNESEENMSNPFYCNCCNKLITGQIK